jgi:hypothetical protein
MYLGLPPDNEFCRPFDWFSEESYWSELNEAPSCTHKDDRVALRNINGDSPFTQPPLKVIEICLQVAGGRRRLAVRG